MEKEVWERMNKGQVVARYKCQCAFFRQQPLSDFVLQQMTKREIFYRAANLYMEQPKHMRREFDAAAMGGTYVRPEPNWWQTVLLKLGINVNY